MTTYINTNEALKIRAEKVLSILMHKICQNMTRQPKWYNFCFNDYDYFTEINNHKYPFASLDIEPMTQAECIELENLTKETLKEWNITKYFKIKIYKSNWFNEALKDFDTCFSIRFNKKIKIEEIEKLITVLELKLT